MDPTYVPPPNLEVTKPVTRRSSARLNINTYKKANDIGLVGNTKRIQYEYSYLHVYFEIFANYYFSVEVIFC